LCWLGERVEEVGREPEAVADVSGLDEAWGAVELDLRTQPGMGLG